MARYLYFSQKMTPELQGAQQITKSQALVDASLTPPLGAAIPSIPSLDDETRNKPVFGISSKEFRNGRGEASGQVEWMQ